MSHGRRAWRPPPAGGSLRSLVAHRHEALVVLLEIRELEHEDTVVAAVAGRLALAPGVAHLDEPLAVAILVAEVPYVSLRSSFDIPGQTPDIEQVVVCNCR